MSILFDNIDLKSISNEFIKDLELVLEGHVAVSDREELFECIQSKVDIDILNVSFETLFSDNFNNNATKLRLKNTTKEKDALLVILLTCIKYPRNNKEMVLASLIYIRLLHLSKLFSEYFNSLLFRASASVLQQCVVEKRSELKSLKWNATQNASGETSRSRKQKLTSDANERRGRRKLQRKQPSQNDGDNDDAHQQATMSTSPQHIYQLILKLIAELHALLTNCNFQTHGESIGCVANCMASVVRECIGAGRAGDELAERAAVVLDALATVQRERGRVACLSACLPLLLCTVRADGRLPPRSSVSPNAALLKAQQRGLASAMCCFQACASRNVTDPSCLGLLQQLCLRVPDRAAYRQVVATVVVALARTMHDQSPWHEFVQRLACHRIPKRRLVAVEVIVCAVQNAVDSQSTDVVAPFLATLARRVCDNTSAVSARALNGFAALIDEQPTLLRDFTLCDDNMLLRNVNKALRVRLVDSRVAVRRCAMRLMIALCTAPYDQSDIAALRCLLADESTAIRKEAIASITQMMIECDERYVAKLRQCWRDGVLALLADQEATVAAAASDALNTALWQPLIDGGEQDSSAWSLFEYLSQTHSSLLVIAAKTAPKKLQSTMIARIEAQSSASTSAQACWCLLAGLSEHSAAALSPVKLCKFALPTATTKATTITTTINNENNDTDNSVEHQQTLCDRVRSHALTIVANCADRMAAVERQQVVDLLFQELKQLTMSSMVAQATISVLNNLSKTLKWRNELLKLCEDRLIEWLLPNGSKSKRQKAVVDETKLCANLFALGKLTAIKGTRKPTERAVTLVVALCSRTPPVGIRERFAQQTVGVKVRANAFVTLGKLCLQDSKLATRCLGTFTQELELPSHAGEHWNIDEKKRNNNDEDEDVIVDSGSAVIRNNVVVILCDLCVRYTHLINDQLPLLANLVADPNELVRQHTVSLLSFLVKEDYVKFRAGSVLSHRLLLALADPSQAVACAAAGVFAALLTRGNGAAALGNSGTGGAAGALLAEAVFHANACTVHEHYNRSARDASARERAVFHLRHSASLRQQLYTRLLPLMTPEQRFAAHTTLVQNILLSFAERKVPVAGEAANVLADVLDLMAHPALQVRAADVKSNANSDEADAHQLPSTASEAVAAAKSTLLCGVVKQYVLENVVPVIIAVRAAVLRTPVMRNVTQYLLFLVEEYGNDALSAIVDRRVVTEIQFDLKEMKDKALQLQAEQQRASAAIASSAAVSTTPPDNNATMAPPPPSAVQLQTPAVANTNRLRPSSALASHTVSTMRTPRQPLAPLTPSSVAPALRSARRTVHSAPRVRATQTLDNIRETPTEQPKQGIIIDDPNTSAPKTPWSVRLKRQNRNDDDDNNMDVLDKLDEKFDNDIESNRIVNQKLDF